MKLYQFLYSPYAAKVRCCLAYKRIAFDTVEVPYLDRRELLQITGGSVHVPVLVDGDTVVADSARITAYLDDKYPPSLRSNGLAVVLEQWADSVLEDVAFKLAAPSVEDKIAELNGGRQDARAMYRVVKERKFGAGCIDAWRAQENALSAQLAGLLAPLRPTPFLLGELPSLADAAVWGNLYMVESVVPGRLAEVAPHLVDWYTRAGAA